MAGISLVFSATRGAYPPCGHVTLTVLNLGAYLVLKGVYDSAVLASATKTLKVYL